MTGSEGVAISEFKVAAAPACLVTYGLGSCLAIAIYDPEKRLGGLAHTLLPQPKPGMDTSRPEKFVKSAIRMMLDELLGLGADRQKLEAKIFGGANMFKALQEYAGESIGQRNISAAREILSELSIPLRAEDVGGNFGRTLYFNLDSGKVTVKSIREGKREQEF